MKNPKLLLLCGLIFVHPASAAEVSLTADYWDYKISGTVNRSGDVQDLDRDLGVEARDHASYGFAWNTGPGWWRPDFAANYTPIKADGQRISAGTHFGPLVIIPGSVARGEADLDDADLSLRYPLKFGWGTIWGGVTIKRITGFVSIRDATSMALDRQQIDQLFPLLHLALSAPLTSWLTLSAQGNAIEYQGSKAYELRTGASIGILGPLGINLGWQYKQYRVSEGDYLFDASLSGALAGVFITLR